MKKTNLSIDKDKILSLKEFKQALIESKNKHKKKAIECMEEGRMVAYAVHRGRMEAMESALNLLQHTNI